MLKNPDVAWQKLETMEQQKLFFFIFERKLPYSIKDGYRINEIPTAARLFEDFVVENTLGVGIVRESSNPLLNFVLQNYPLIKPYIIA
jgi:hypothetical protein